MKKKIKAGLDFSELQCIEFTHQEFESIKWEKENKEFIYQNKFYDIVKSEVQLNGNIKLYCIDDKQESKLFAALDYEVKKNTDIEKSGKPGAKKILKLIKINASMLEHEDATPLLGINFPLKEYQYPNYTYFQLIQTPPPQYTF